MHETSFKSSVPAILQDNSASAKQTGLFADAIDLAVYDRIESIEEEWLAAQKIAQISVYQRFEWVKGYLASQQRGAKVQPFIIVGRHNGETVFILPCHVKGHLIRRLKFIGGKHVNFNLGIVPERSGPALKPEDFQRLFARIRRMMPSVGYLAFCCQPGTWQGAPNPLIGDAHQRSANPTFLLDLRGGFDATLARGNAKRKRKKFRQQCRRAEQLGGYRLHSPASTGEVCKAIDVFIEQKSRRLSELGIKDVFSEAGTREFLIDMATQSLSMDEPILKLFVLEIGGKAAAIFGGGVHARRLSGFFSSIDSENFSQLSPGEMLLYLIVEDACAKGYVQMDLGAGDERYKRSWSNEVVQMYDHFQSFNLAGTPIVVARRIYGSIRRHIREDERYWNIYKKLRRFKSRF